MAAEIAAPANYRSPPMDPLGNGQADLRYPETRIRRTLENKSERERCDMRSIDPPDSTNCGRPSSGEAELFGALSKEHAGKES